MVQSWMWVQQHFCWLYNFSKRSSHVWAYSSPTLPLSLDRVALVVGTALFCVYSLAGAWSNTLSYLLDESPGEDALYCMHVMAPSSFCWRNSDKQHGTVPCRSTSKPGWSFHPLSIFRKNVKMMLTGSSGRMFFCQLLGDLEVSWPLCGPSLLLVVQKLFICFSVVRRNCSKYRCIFDILRRV